MSVTGAATLLAGPAQAAPTELHAEDMRNTGGHYVDWTMDDGSDVRSLLSNGSATGTVVSAVPFSKITVVAAGSYSGDAEPKVRVDVDGVLAGTLELEDRNLHTYSLSGAWESGEHTVALTYLNDAGPSSAVVDYVAAGTDVIAAPEPSTPPAYPITPTPPVTPQPSVPQERDYTIHPFSQRAFSNTRIGSAVQFAAENDARHAAFREGSAGVASQRWSISVEHASADDPIATLRANGETHTIRIPRDAATTGGTDQHMTVIQPDRRTAYEMWGMQKTSDMQWTARYMVVTDLHGEGMEAGARASGISHLHGLIRKEELQNLDIQHSLAIGISGSKLRSVNGGTGVWPAQAEDGNNSWAYTGNIPMGTMFAIPASVDIEKLNLTPEGHALARALQQYGGHVLIQAGNTNLYAEKAADAGQVDNLDADWSQLRDLLRVVTNNTADNIAGAR